METKAKKPPLAFNSEKLMKNLNPIELTDPDTTPHSKLEFEQIWKKAKGPAIIMFFRRFG